MNMEKGLLVFPTKELPLSEEEKLIVNGKTVRKLLEETKLGTSSPLRIDRVFVFLRVFQSNNGAII